MVRDWRLENSSVFGTHEVEALLNSVLGIMKGFADNGGCRSMRTILTNLYL